jgi:ribosomal protein S18 acetylase RimI-like enzyme
MIHIRNAFTDDIPIIRDIAYKTWPIAFRDILKPEQIDYMLEMMYSPSSLTEQIDIKGHRFLLSFFYDLESNNKESGHRECRYIGYASYELNIAGSDKTKIHKIYVLPKYQGSGCGKALIKEIEKIALFNNSPILSLNVNRNNRAITFYKNFGFKIVNEENIDIGNGFLMEDYVMEKVL